VQDTSKSGWQGREGGDSGMPARPLAQTTTLKGNEPKMSNININDAVSADIATLTTAADVVASAVERYNVAKRDTTAALFTTPMVALATAVDKDTAGAAFSHLVDMLEGEDVEDLAHMLEIASKLASKLAVTLATLDTAEYVKAAERLVGLAASPYQLVSDELLTAAGAAVTKWKAAYASYQQASGANVRRVTGRARGGLSGPQRGPTGGTRGVGKWFEDHGWFFTAACPHCDHVVQSASNTGSFAHEMAKHMGTHRPDAEGRAQRPYEGDAEYDHARDAMYAVAADDGPESETTPEGWVVSRNYTEANVA